MSRNHNRNKRSRDPRKTFLREIGEKANRKLDARRQENRNLWYGLGLLGIVGWSIAIPTLVGVAIGLWLESILAGSISWTLIFLFGGLVVGCMSAWYWVQHALKDE